MPQAAATFAPRREPDRWRRVPAGRRIAALVAAIALVAATVIALSLPPKPAPGPEARGRPTTLTLVVAVPDRPAPPPTPAPRARRSAERPAPIELRPAATSPVRSMPVVPNAAPTAAPGAATGPETAMTAPPTAGLPSAASVPRTLASEPALRLDAATLRRAAAGTRARLREAAEASGAVLDAPHASTGQALASAMQRAAVPDCLAPNPGGSLLAIPVLAVQALRGECR